MSYDDYVGRTERREDTVWPFLLRGMAATIDVILPENGVLPPLWHWMLFQDWLPASGLGTDGHPKRGGFLPPVDDLPRRMWAGGRVAFTAPLYASDPVERISTIAKIDEKTGGTGPLVFVTVKHEISGPRGLAISEEQDLVYRGIEGAAVKPAEAAAAPPPEAFSRLVIPDPVMLFRYSALTGNSHRIHYDADYARSEEGYPALVVHGPLQATLLADLAQRLAKSRQLAHIAYRGRRAAFAPNPLLLEGWAEGDGLMLRSRDDQGAVCMTAEVQFRRWAS